MNVTTRILGATLGACLFSAAAVAAQAPRRVSQVDVSEATVLDLQAAMKAGRVTSVELVDAYLARIAAYDAAGPEINAMIRLNPRARADAAALDNERRQGNVRGPLHGIPIILKDNYNTADLPTSAGSLALATVQSSDDAFVVRRLRAAGVVVIGKSNMHELAAGITTISSLGGQTRNPYDLRRCPGGSSGGTGAAIAASFATVGWGSDTCGSIRIPSAYNSLFGLRPTQGLVSRNGVVPLSHTQDVTGPLARTVTDLVIALDVTVGRDSADPDTRVLAGRPIPRFTDSLNAQALRGARLGVLTNYFRDTDGEIADTVRAAIRAMKEGGAEIVDVTIPTLDSLVAGSGVINFELKFDLADYLTGISKPPVHSLRELRESGLYHAALENTLRLRDTVQNRESDAYHAALAKRDVFRTRVIAVLDSLQLDALVYPTMRQRPAIIGEPQPGGTCQLASNTGLPALSAPAGFTADGLPVGIELLGRAFSDWRLVSLAYSFEQSTGGPRRRPPATTPALVNGLPPKPVTLTVTAQASPAVARGIFTFDPMRSELDWNVHITGVSGDRVEAAVLQRRDSSVTRVVQRLSGPGSARGAGKMYLNGLDRRALLDGRLTLSLVTVDRRSGAQDGQLVIPR